MVNKKFLYFVVKGVSEEGRDNALRQSEACAWRPSDYYDGYYDLVFRLPHTEDDPVRAWATAYVLYLVYTDAFPVPLAMLEQCPRDEWPVPPSETIPFTDNFRNFDSSEAAYQWGELADDHTNPADYCRVRRIERWMGLAGHSPKDARSSGLTDDAGDGDLTEQGGGAADRAADDVPLTKAEALKRAMDARAEMDAFIAELQGGGGSSPAM